MSNSFNSILAKQHELELSDAKRKKYATHAQCKQQMKYHSCRGDFVLWMILVIAFIYFIA